MGPTQSAHRPAPGQLGGEEAGVGIGQAVNLGMHGVQISFTAGVGQGDAAPGDGDRQIEVQLAVKYVRRSGTDWGWGARVVYGDGGVAGGPNGGRAISVS